MNILQSNKKLFKLFTLSFTVIVIFFIFLEVALRFFEYTPRIQFQNMYLPYWISKVDSIYLDDYNERLKVLRELNQDLYAYRPDPMLGYTLKPNYRREITGYSSVFSVENMPEWVLISGEDGYRIGSHSKEIKNYEEGGSIFILGDSSSFGWGVDFEETYGFVFTEILNRSLGPGNSLYRVINRSMPGLSTFSGFATVRGINEIKQGDRVLVSLGSNDQAPASISDYKKYINLQSTPEKIRTLLERFMFFKMLRSFWVSSNISFQDKAKSSVNRVSVEEYKNNLKNIFDIIRKRGGKPSFVNICNSNEYTLVARELTNVNSIPYVDFIKQVKPFFADIPRRFPKKFIQYFDAYGQKMDENELFVVLFPDGCHPNAIGHHLLGEILFKVLEQETRETSKP